MKQEKNKQKVKTDARFYQKKKKKTVLTKEQRSQTLKRVMKEIQPYWPLALLSLLCAVVSVAAQLYVPILTGDAIDYMIKIHAVQFEPIFRILVIIGITVAITFVAQWIFNLCNNRITYCVSRNLRNCAIKKIQKLPLSYLDSHASGDLVSRIIADVDIFTDGLLMGFTQLFTGILTIGGTIGFMLYVNIPIAVAVICITPLSLVVAAFIAKYSYRYFQSQTLVRGEQTAFINEMIEGQKVVQAYGHEEKNMEVFDEINGRLQSVSLKAVFYSSITNPSTRFVNNMVYAAVGLVGAICAIGGRISVGQLSCFLSYANQYTKPFNEISGVVTELQNALSCAARVFDLLDKPEEVADLPDAKHLVSDGRVDISHVYFSYLKDQPLICDMNLKVSPGQRIAIVGPTGCGKTTLINLLMRFYDVDSGEITVAGQPIRSVTRASLRKNFGMVLQDTWLKQGTVLENIAYGKPNATREEIIEAAKLAHAHSFIKRLPKGYDTIIYENGGNISQGQKQLLCIARVMLCLPPMLILDEATSSIDTRTEVKIQSAFARMMQGRTSFIVAHRLSTIREADQILVMNHGRVIEQGTHEELLKQNGFYANLYQSQFAGVGE